MSKAKPWAKWPIPDEIHPVGTRCFVIRVPDQVQHVGAFRGAMLNLASAYKWADDPEHNAREVAAVWREVIENMEDCQVFDVRQSPTDPCILQKYDSGLGEWVDFANMADCVQQQLPPDNPPGRSQPGENSNGPNPPIGGCYEYDLTLQANGFLVLPVAIHAGYTITISNPQGATRGSAVFFDTWECYDGHLFVLGQCGPDTALVPEDPMPDKPHMALVMQVPDGSFHQMLDGVGYTVPSGMPDGNYVFQVNDSDVSDNSGSLTFHVKICRAKWCHYFDFTIDEQGWSHSSFNGAGGAYLTGSYWYSTVSGSYKNLAIGISFPLANITDFDALIWRSIPEGTSPDTGDSILHADPDDQYLIPDHRTAPAGESFVSWHGDTFAAHLDFFASVGAYHAEDVRVISIAIQGTGINPFGDDNCA